MKLTRLAAAAGLLVAAGIGGVVVASPALAYPDGVVGTATINSTTFTPGDTAVVTVENTTPGGLTMQIFSAPVTIGTGSVGADGTGSVSGVIPAGYSGTHTIQVTGAGGEIYPFTVSITKSGGGGGGNGNGGGSTDDNGGGLANTGAAVTGIGILGGILVAGGVFFVVAGRRRTTANQTPSV